MRDRGRTRRLMGLGARTGGALLKTRLGGQADWRALGEALFEGLSELKGPAMKLAQIMSQWDDLLPPDLAEELARLQRQAEPMPWPRIHEALIQQYGDIDHYFSEVEERPFASASMGQVHRATTHEGETVVLKVQYPGLAEVLESDLIQVRRIMRLGRWFKVPQARLDALFEELAESLRGELDYYAEADALARYRERYKDDPRLVIPEPLPALSGPHVLAMRYVEGTPLRELTDADDATRQGIAQTLADWITQELFTYGELHADPHAGNFAADGQGRLVIYDLGAVIAVPDARLKAMMQLLDATLKHDAMGMDEALMQMGGRQGQGAPLALYRESAECIAPLFEPGEQDFSDVRVHRRLRELTPKVWAAMDRLQPPADTLLLSRALNGHYWNLVRLGARLDMHERTRPLLEWA
ncbi:AarF/ABC1/UbiB kinase family protein [Halomonas sp. FeN2]|uniref:AarF/ABC1/UbiB kinase family protein n=1 Tax=Vreelandella neptunia TaxID=115551 RepID=A0ABZ0YQT1_9GAMM|nr:MULTISPECIES: AarF/ABC1/UbiB kinase family protein [Halomonas]TDV99465.1 putative unusual protein kinase regulating ubiquinone biosynthesis (AarF/ABC1/UbiB family) [Halomonas alkaliantarctica]MBF57834.1 ABC-1 protein [Halomonas sp.]MDN3561614.1 AarF/ABC1/UbiB kinase family protein [Halomonas neptunia]UBR49735.1 AarF/ABC1/UbiB kinase family protein [Halomonas sp. FeN2]WQH14518.1 AarF/ABC1/UbiB kinase family protein [Halomonas neptunia]